MEIIMDSEETKMARLIIRRKIVSIAPKSLTLYFYFKPLYYPKISNMDCIIHELPARKAIFQIKKTISTLLLLPIDVRKNLASYS
jgi:hypothetical protein